MPTETPKTPAKSVPTPSETESTTLSTRFNPKQRKAIDQAAKILGCTPAKLIREASIDRAVSIINASKAQATLRNLATKLIAPAVNPLMELCWFSRHDPNDNHTEQITLEEWNNMSHAEKSELAGSMPEYDNFEARLLKPDMTEIRQIKTALQTCPSEFIRLMLEQWEAVETGGTHYKPELSISELLGGQEEE